MNSTLWLLAFLIAGLGLCGLSYVMGKLIADRWDDADATQQPASNAPYYRTADELAMRRDLRKLRALANADTNLTATATAKACTRNCNQGRCCTCSHLGKTS